MFEKENTKKALTNNLIEDIMYLNNNKGDNMLTEIIDIPVYKKDYLKKAIAKLNKKALKMGCDLLELSFDNEHTISYNEHPITGHTLTSPLVVHMVTATLNYNIPMIEGYELIATLDIYPSENGDVVMVSAVPDKVVPDEYKNATEIHCDHCGWKRNRHHSVVLREVETGKHIEVGSTCVKDFFGIDPKGFMFMAAIKFDNIVGGFKDDSVGNYGREIWSYDLIDVLAYAAAATVKWGWLSKGKAWELNNKYEDAHYVSTASHVLDNLNPWPKMPESFKVDIEEEDKVLAEKVIEYFKELDPNNNDYLLNCCKVVKLGYVPYKHVGVAVSMVSAYERAMGKKAEYEKKVAEEKVNPSSFVGEIGDRLKGIIVECTYSRFFESDWGGSTLYAFKDVNGNIYKTFYSGSSWELEIGDKVMIDGTVKKHNTFNGKEETMLNRVSVKDIPEDTLFTTKEFEVA